MNQKNLHITFIIIICCSSVLFSSCKNGLEQGTIVLTTVAGNLNHSNNLPEKDWRYIAHTQIVALNPKNKSPKTLSAAFFSACAPSISYDGKFMIFSAQKNQNDLWQLWEMDLKNLKVRQVTALTQDCLDPFYLPDGNLVFSQLAANKTVNSEPALFTCNRNGSEIRQITFNPHAYFASTVLKDGRILTISRQLYPNQKEAMYFVLRPDGTKQELFYKGINGSKLRSRGWETNNHKIVFIESDSSQINGGNIMEVNYNRPLHSSINLSSNLKGDFYNIYPLHENKFLVSYRPSKDEAYALYEFDSESKTLGQVIYKDNNYQVLEALVIKSQERPRILPSEVNLDSKTGLLICQDINFTDNPSNQISKAIKIELMGIDASLGTVAVEEDGSFYLKVLADTPFRIQTIDQNGKIVNGPGSWMYIRPSERRGCVGCHEDNEQVPENRQLLSVKKPPINIPVSTKGMNINKISVK